MVTEPAGSSSDPVEAVPPQAGPGDSVPAQVGPLGAAPTDGRGWWRLDPAPASAGRARALVTGWLRDLGVVDEDDLATVQLLVSEAVTNAVTHGAPPVELSVAHRPHRVRVAVADGLPEGAVHPQERDLDAPSGRGLLLIDVMSSAWGVRLAGAGKEVWFEVALR